MNIHNIILRPNDETFEDVYIVTDLVADTDLFSILRSSQPLQEHHILFFTYNLLRGLKFLHSANVVHGNLKPSCLRGRFPASFCLPVRLFG